MTTRRDQFRPICLPRNPSDFTTQPNKRFTIAEDCLFANIFAPTNATAQSKLPVLFFIQGGGFSSNSNANFNCSGLASFGNIVVVQINYRVGPFGFLQSREVQANGTLNAGLKDQIQGLKWAKANIAKVRRRKATHLSRKPFDQLHFADPASVLAATV